MPGSNGKGVKAAIGSFSAVSWFVLLFIATIVVAIVTLSASQLQGRLLAFSHADVPFSVWQVERIRKQWNLQQEIIARQSETVTKLRAAVDAAEADTSEAMAKGSVANGRAQTAQNTIVAKLRLYVPLEFVDDTTDSQELTIRIERSMAILSTQLLPATKQTVEGVYAAHQQAMRDRDEALQMVQAAVVTSSEKKEKLEREEENLGSYENKISEIVNPDGTLNSAEVTRIHDLMSEFAFIEGFALGTLYKFAVLPNEFLVMVLVVAMGILGSTLQLTYDYYRVGGIPRTSHFLLRPMLGAITAIVVFVLLKAGVLVVTDSAKLGEGAPLNPFFIGFVGIVSGFLSENALETVRSVGQSWFRNAKPDQPLRWAASVRLFLSDTKTIKDFSNKSGVDEALVDDWFNERAPVPPDIQKAIAVWLEKDQRLLFSDVPPERA